MKKLLLSLTLLSSISSYASTEQAFEGELVDYDKCSMFSGYAIDTTKLTNLQSSDVYFRIQRQRDYFRPTVVINNTDDRGIARTNPKRYGAQDCLNMKSCIDQFGSKGLNVASTCTDGLLEIKFIVD